MRQNTKVRLRDLRSVDLETVYQWRNDPEVTQYLANLKISRTQIQLWFDDYDHNPRGRFFAIETEQGQFIGYTGIRDIVWDSRSAMMDIIIGEKSHWGQGYGQNAVDALLKLAFDELELNKVSLAVLPFNIRGIRCYEKCGFRRAGFFPEKYFRHDKLWHPIRMEITRSQFHLARKVRPS